MLLLGSDLCAPTPNSYGEALVPNVMVLEMGFGEVIRFR